MLYTIGYPKITGSLMLKIPGANPNLAILFDALFLLNKNVTINNTIVLPDPPIIPNVGTNATFMICGIA